MLSKLSQIGSLALNHFLQPKWLWYGWGWTSNLSHGWKHGEKAPVINQNFGDLHLQCMNAAVSLATNTGNVKNHCVTMAVDPLILWEQENTCSWWGMSNTQSCAQPFSTIFQKYVSCWQNIMVPISAVIFNRYPASVEVMLRFCFIKACTTGARQKMSKKRKAQVLV